LRFVFLGSFATLCLLGIGFGTGFGWPLGHPRATQAWRKGGPWVELRKCFVCNKRQKMRGWGKRNCQNCQNRVIGKIEGEQPTVGSPPKEYNFRQDLTMDGMVQCLRLSTMKM